MGRLKLTPERERMSEGKQENGKRRWIISNLVYGQHYPMFWLENQLKSLNDPSNLPALRRDWDIEYAIFTDDQTLTQITRHPNFMQLGQNCEINIIKLAWPTDSDQFASRYGLLVQMFRETLKVAHEKNAYAMSAWVADLVFAKDSLPKMLGHLTRGHDAVLNVPIRSAVDSVHPLLGKLSGAPSELELFEMAYNNLHHLWTHSTWDNPYFSKMPYSMLWNSGTGLVAHNFGVTPIVFRPLPGLTEVKGVIDADVPSFFSNPYWASDWTDAAVAGVEPLSNGHYPPFRQKQVALDRSHADEQMDYVAQWSLRGTVPVQAANLHKPLFYPSRKTFNNQALQDAAEGTALRIQKLIKDLRSEGDAGKQPNNVTKE